jgi:hypothetical protein
VKRKDETKPNRHNRTHEAILPIYDALGDSIHTAQPFQTRLDPP